jgi:sugar-specific transcriptional regulator TrmB
MSKNIDLNIVRDLKAFGFNEKESTVYIELLQGGEMSAVTLGKTLGLHRQFVYNALAVLKERGLVLQIGETRAKWRAQNPRKFIALAEEQELRAAKMSDHLLALTQHKTGQEFETIEGMKAFRARSIESIRSAPHASTVLMISGQWLKYFEHMGMEAHNEWERVRLAKEIKFRVIGPRSFETLMKEESSGRVLTDYRVFPGLEENLVNTVIYEGHFDLEIYGEPHLLFSVKNAAVTESQKKFFEALWEKSEKL